MKSIDILQAMSALSGITMIVLGSGWLKTSIRQYLAKGCRIHR